MLPCENDDAAIDNDNDDEINTYEPTFHFVL